MDLPQRPRISASWSFFTVFLMLGAVSFVYMYYNNSASWMRNIHAPLNKTNVSHTQKSIREMDPNTSEPDVVYGHDACGKKPIFLLTLVHSAIKHREKRDAIRKTWGGMKKYKSYRLHNVFIVGQTPNKTMSRLLDDENKIHGDIVKGDFLDTYRNLTTKMVFWLHWANVYCQEAEFVLKCDDDMIINPDKAVDYLEGLDSETKDKLYVGSQLPGTRPIRDSRSPWYASKKIWPNNRYPLYHSGRAIIVSKKTISLMRRSVLNGSADKKYNTNWRQFGIDDVYMGALASVSGVKVHLGRLVLEYEQIPECDVNKCDKALSKISWYAGSPRILVHIWRISRNII